jgi:hypothetical protein
MILGCNIHYKWLNLKYVPFQLKTRRFSRFLVLRTSISDTSVYEKQKKQVLEH